MNNDDTLAVTTENEEKTEDEAMDIIGVKAGEREELKKMLQD